jgi:sulfotransferase
MAKTFHFIAGMPRSGSTLLCNILCQNPDFRATGTSPLPALIGACNQTWSNSPEAKANFTDDDRMHLLKSLFENYHLPFHQKVIFEKSRAWPAFIETLENVFGQKPKMIVTTRFMPEIIASCEKIFLNELTRKDSVSIPVNMSTIRQRVTSWSSAEQMVGQSYNILKDAVQRGHKQCLLRVDFEDLTTNPQGTLDRIHDFIEYPRYQYDFEHVEQVIKEKDEFHGFKPDALHKIRSKVKPLEPDYKDVLGPIWTELTGSDYNFLN